MVFFTNGLLKMKPSKILNWYRKQVKKGLTEKQIIKRFDKLIKKK